MTMTRELRVRFDIDPDHPTDTQATQILAIAWGLVLANEDYFRRNPDAPCCLGCAGVRYVEPEKCGPWCQYADTASVILRRRVVTCLGAAPYACAKKRLTGVGATLWLAPLVQPMVNADVILPGQWHLVVRLPDGRIVDPIEKLIAAPPGTCDGEVCDGKTR